MKFLATLFCIVLALIGLGLTGGGAWLLRLGGSPYYAIVGLAYLVAALLLWRRKTVGGLIVLLVAMFTFPWALWESGLNFWALFARLMSPIALAGFALLFAPSLSPTANRKLFYGGASVTALIFVAGFGLSFVPHGIIHPSADITAYKTAKGDNSPSDWTSYGRTTAGDRYSPFDQINRGNVSKLDLAWTYRTGKGDGADQNTPLQIGDTVYTCTPTDVIAALDADTGKPRWTFDPKATAPYWQRCRGLGYYKMPTEAQSADGLCDERLVQTTIDARLLAIDSKTGAPCKEFGDHGTVQLSQGMGEVKTGYYFQTSAPLIARNLIVVGGWVTDNQEVGEPPGVIRAFNVVTGELEWAWDLGNPEITKLPPEGQTYTRATPNMWTTAAFDDKLGLIYAPLGNTTPDYYGVNRPAFADQYNATLVALDVTTGREKWKFQTVHHDIWDYDLPAQPALVDLPDGNGATVPALLQTTKRGQLFLLDRRTGTPLAEVQEKPVPQQGSVPEEKLSPTQPYSVGMPTIGAERVTEQTAWGLTMFDQLACRIAFRKMRYDGDFTPIGTQYAIQQPGNLGGLNWGSVSVDLPNNRVFMNDIRVPSLFALIPREEYVDFALTTTAHGPSAPQRGTPYAMATEMWTSRLRVPCTQPPFGTVTAVDLKTRKIAWQVPAGTAEELGPFKIKTKLPMPMGLPSYAGTSATAGGIVFFAGFQDYYIRAYDAENGAELWKYPLPVGSSAIPMTYVSPKTGKQYVLISVGGAPYSKDVGDYVLAFSLKDGA
ncbi:membrane-bound PQQ-dependent dehydrogenase, glucose/quinate/shikimate family [Rhizobium leguminosarum bv. viciae]|uniref:membrane-bound PQQ-dependent dehydrogenase, glucose/quinate/shikimate family n=1 Tax=Rhizobium leguminosarum TaxID=384 RepID=UPI00103C633E|nr:membrane-bound PQQ-dependent dehydrogenase, glucose/quinate/shikimate family [Rhizobium leguminosarum]TBY72556.1 membrane-bound PQQ-dependent dehydrogenase, glucose/quinate/shikimate family [Rhizobium leguminosarum bv. viciae]